MSQKNKTKYWIFRVTCEGIKVGMAGSFEIEHALRLHFFFLFCQREGKVCEPQQVN